MRPSLVGRAAAGISLALAASGCAVSTQQEVDMGAQYAQQINQQLPLLNDAEISRYINVLGNQIASVADDRSLQWHFYVVNATEVNAFAVPGGYVYVNRGLIERAQNMSQLAGVIGHEIGHVTHRHSVKQMQQQQGAQVGLTLGCVLAPSFCNSGVGSTAINAGASAVFAKFSRSDESEADQAGIQYTQRAGIDPRGIPQMFRILLDERTSRPGAVDAWFATHPLEEDRIAATEKTISSISPTVLASLTKDSQNFHTFQTRVRQQPAAPKSASGQ